MTKLGKFNELLQNPNINLNLRQVRAKLVQLFINKVNRQAIKPNWNGVRMSQSPQFFLDIYEDTRNGRKIMASELTNYDKNYLLKEGLIKKSELAPMGFFSDPKYTKRIETKEEFDSLIAKGEVYVKPGEVIIPFSYFEQFGLNEWVQEDGEFYEENFNLNKIFETNHETAVKELRTVNSFRDQDAKERAKTIEALGKGWEAGNDYTGFLFQKFGEESSDLLRTTVKGRAFDTAAAIEWFNALESSLQVFNNRVPTSSMSAGFIGEVVAWNNGSGNVIFANEKKNLLDGGDYDIDQLQVYSRFIAKDR